MKRPGIGTYLIGNPLSALAMFGFTAWLTWRWYIGEIPGIAPVIAGIAMTSAFDANSKLSDYHHWQREWQAMSGQPPRASLLARFVSSTVVKLLIGVPLWCVFAYGMWNGGANPTARAAETLFWLGSGIIIITPLYRRLRMWRASRRHHAAIHYQVSLSTKLPSHSPSLKEANAALPAYCVALLHPKRPVPLPRK